MLGVGSELCGDPAKDFVKTSLRGEGSVDKSFWEFICKSACTRKDKVSRTPSSRCERAASWVRARKANRPACGVQPRGGSCHA